MDATIPTNAIPISIIVALHVYDQCSTNDPQQHTQEQPIFDAWVTSPGNIMHAHACARRDARLHNCLLRFAHACDLMVPTGATMGAHGVSHADDNRSPVPANNRVRYRHAHRASLRKQ